MSALDQVLSIGIVKTEHPNLHKQASAELATLRDDKLKLEIAVRDFLRAFAMRGKLLPSEFSEAHDTLAAMVNKGDE